MVGRVYKMHRRIVRIEISDPELDYVDVFTFELYKRVGGLQRFEVLMGGDGNRPVLDIHLRCPIGRVVSAQIIEFGEVVNAITVNIGRLPHLILLNPILIRSQRRQIIRKCGRTRLPPRNRHRNLVGSGPAPPCQRHIQNEIVGGGRLHNNGGLAHRNRNRSRRYITILTRTRY